LPLATGQVRVGFISWFVDYNCMLLDSSSIEKSRFDLRKEITFPEEMSVELAEMIGILVGDGHLSVLERIDNKGSKFTQSTVFIAGNCNEQDYLEHIQRLFLKLFNVPLTYREDKRSDGVLLVCYSKGIVQYLSKVCQVPVGRKCAIVKVPQLIFDSKSVFQMAFLRGLADTDFSLCFKNKSKKGYAYPVIKGSFRSRFLIQDLERLFSFFGFIHCTCYGLIRKNNKFGSDVVMHAIYLNGVKNLELWINIVGFSQPKFQNKILEWRETGQSIPKKKKKSPGRELNSRCMDSSTHSRDLLIA
jgi:hypothetical protein